MNPAFFKSYLFIVSFFKSHSPKETASGGGNNLCPVISEHHFTQIFSYSSCY